MAEKFKEQAIIIRQEEIADDIYSMWLRTEEIAAHAKAGQFVSVYCNEGSRLLPRPISIDVYKRQPYSGMVAAFAVPEQLDRKTALRLMLAHTDFPCFKIKPNPEVKTKDYRQLNVEPYGGMLKNTWFDRPLGIYGKVVLESRCV